MCKLHMQYTWYIIHGSNVFLFHKIYRRLKSIFRYFRLVIAAMPCNNLSIRVLRHVPLFASINNTNQYPGASFHSVCVSVFCRAMNCKI